MKYSVHCTISELDGENRPVRDEHLSFRLDVGRSALSVLKELFQECPWMRASHFDQRPPSLAPD